MTVTFLVYCYGRRYFHFAVHSSGWQNSISGGCRPELPVFLLAVIKGDSQLLGAASTPWLMPLPPSPSSKLFCLMSESPNRKREGFQDNAIHKKGSLLPTRARAPAASNALVQGQRARSPSCYPNLQGMHKWLLAGLSRLVTCLQSNSIGTNFRGLFSNLGIRGLFSFPFVSYQAHIDWLAPGCLMGVGNLTISGEAKTQVQAACHGASPGSLTKTNNGRSRFSQIPLLYGFSFCLISLLSPSLPYISYYTSFKGLCDWILPNNSEQSI